MEELEILIGLVLAATVLAAGARRVGAPYPVFLALGGAILAFVPGAPSFTVLPELALALFVAPVLLDAAFDASPRDLRDNWSPVIGLVVFAVGLTTIAVAAVARALMPAIPWASAIALGAIVAPPDAAAATAVLRQLRPPHRILTILQGESLLNDATALLIYRLAVGAVAAHGFSVGAVAPTFLFAVAGSLVVGPALAWLSLKVMDRVEDVPTAVILQFVTTFGVWILADRIGLSGVLTMVCYAVAAARTAPERTPARLRVPSYAVWETVVFLLNVLAFAFIGLQLRPILGSLEPSVRGRYFVVAAAVLVTVIVVRLAWHMSFNAVIRWRDRRLRLQSAAADAAADDRQRPHHLVGRHARHRHAGGSTGAAVGVPVSRPDRADRVRGRPRHTHHPGAHAWAALRVLDLQDDDPVGHEAAVGARTRAAGRAGAAVTAIDRRRPRRCGRNSSPTSDR